MSLFLANLSLQEILYVTGCKNLVVCENSGYPSNSPPNAPIIGRVRGTNEYYRVDLRDRLDS